MNPQNITILCVDDEQSNLSPLEYIIAARGYVVVTAMDGKSALEIIYARKIDLVILDTKMPEMNGFELCEKIKKSEKTKDIPVLMTAPLTAKYERMKGMESGVDDFVTKPFDQVEINAKIRLLLKINELNNNLNSAYDNITRMADVGATIIKKFNPIEFNLMTKLDDIVGQIIRRMSDTAERPEIVMVRIRNEQNHDEWYHYKCLFDKLERKALQLNLVLGLPPGQESQLLFYNEGVMEDQMFQFFAAKLRSQNIMVKNMVCYKSKDLSMFALNYGRQVSSYDAAVLNSLVMQTLFMRSLSTQVKETEDAFEYTVQSLARASEASDEDTGKHIVRVGLYCALVAKKLMMPEPFTNSIRVQAALHDVGKIHIPPSVLKKPGKLTDEEWAIMRSHPTYGAKIVGEHPRFKLAKSLALFHHERWDGSGYPNGASGEAIPIEGRIISIADQYDALRNARIYKPSFDHKKTFQILTEGDGRTIPQHFDPQVLKAFIELSSKFEEVYEVSKA